MAMKQRVITTGQRPNLKLANQQAPTNWHKKSSYRIYYISREDELIHYAGECIYVLLENDRKARPLWLDIILAWELPEITEILKSAMLHTRDALSYAHKAMLSKDTALPAYVVEELARLQPETVIPINSAIDRFVDYAFYKPTTWYLLAAIVRNSLIVYAERNVPGFEADNLVRWQPALNKGKPQDIDALMTDTSIDIRFKRNLTSWLTKVEICAHNADVIHNTAIAWYKSRKNPGTIELYLDELGSCAPNRSQIERDIAICDEATGYPRKWRSK